MDWKNPRQRAAFLDLHSDNPREGPGDLASTTRAFAAAALAIKPRNDGSELRVLDIACGPGMQTQHLASLAPRARITALDINLPFIERLDAWVTEQGLGDRVVAVQGDMTQLDFAPGSADLVWCEGAVYLLGVEAALASWRRLLDESGCIAFTEPVFLSEQLPPQVVENWAEYPAMTDVAGVVARVNVAGFKVVESFVLGASAWAAYYDPLQQRVISLRSKYLGNPDGALVIEEGQQEIDAWRNHGEHFSYAFFVVQPED